MKQFYFRFCLPAVVVFVFAADSGQSRYQPNWSSLDSRPLPQWFDEAKFGIFVNWGVYSVPSFGSEWFWQYWASGNKHYVDFMTSNYPPTFTYPDFAPRLTAEFYNPDYWADLFQASGARYVVTSSKHHEGYTMWPSNYSWNWNSMDVGAKRDLLGDLAVSIRKRTKLQFGIYHSLFEWFHPLYLEDKQAGFRTNKFVTAKTMPELYELVNKYRPTIIWSDGNWEASDVYWKSKEFLAWLYNESPVKDSVVTNDRWGNTTMCKHGGFFNCNDRFNPGVLQNHKWENAMTIDRKSWGFRREAPLADYLNMDDLLQLLAETVSCGGNLLINVGPSHEGLIVPIYEERLRQMGQWLQVNGDAIYYSKPWVNQNDTVTKGVWYTSKPSRVYAIVLDWPSDNELHMGAVDPKKVMNVRMLGYDQPLDWRPSALKGVIVSFPILTPAHVPCQWAWVLKITFATN